MKFQRSPLQLSLFYLIVAALWIFCSDALLLWLGLDRDTLNRYQTLKGVCFVLVTGFALYCALNQYRLEQRRARSALKHSEERLALALESAQEGLWDWDMQSGQVYYSRQYCDMLGYTLEEFGATNDSWLSRLHPDDRERAGQRLKTLLAGRSTHDESSFRMRHRDGGYRWLHYRGQMLLDAQGQPSRFIGTASDVTRRRADEDSLRQAAAVFDSTLEGVLVTDREQRIVHVNPAFSRITGYAVDEVLGKLPSLLKSGRHDEAFYQSLWHALNSRGAWSGEVWNRRKDGEVFPMWQCIRSIRDESGTLTHYVAVFSDVSAIKHSQHELDYLAHHDALTGLPNRLLFGERIEQAIQRGGALLLLDLDHFKIVNESLGHNTGDQLLKLIGERLSEAIGANVTLARLGGDEFGLLSCDCSEADQASQLALELLDSLAQPFAINGETLFIGASIGISLFPDDGDSVEQLMRNADSALARAKSSGRQTFSFYSQDMTALAQQRVRLEAELRQALEQDELRVHYQPIHRLDDRRMIGAEALVRWQHPERGLVPPGEFIPVAEDSGLIGAIDAWVLEQACTQMRRWQALGLQLEFIAVNVSSRLFSRGELDLRVERVLRETGLDPAQLELEVTESAVMDDPQRAEELLTQLHRLGVRLAIDDFGTGYSSLARLKSLPVHKLKLDQSFVRGLPQDGKDAAIAHAVITLGQSLGLHVLAEGIETEEQATYLREIGCPFGQGYWFGRPQPAERLLAVQADN
ncbi:GGDEF domain-containing phosphodiesterase [Pseudomonas sp. SO81]|uniref:putative bifunctional diguanylate cyclase/phosphodiesterase n=1 Tax=Pseudomonas sp. SO81 TaxID=2983246 RepID=UPI0025A39839|nr:GGDEF domain-containing phosphodiesterase [Pseudomonas sp. SO81]WJN59376.1 diguanylate cyclase/phosphodiesterase (GGDEF & EAL domains) with PAS/PAC sensor(s) [Pseudomonas sp. SO81]